MIFCQFANSTSVRDISNRGAAQKQPLVQKGAGERLAPGQASECAHRRDCRTHKPANNRKIPQTVAACGRLQRGEGIHHRVAHQQLQLGGQHHRRTLQVKVAGRDFLQTCEAAAAHQKLCRHIAERGGDTAVDGHDHHTDAQISPVQGILRLESLQPRSVTASEHLHQNGSLEMAKQAVHSAPDTLGNPNEGVQFSDFSPAFASFIGD